MVFFETYKSRVGEGLVARGSSKGAGEGIGWALSPSQEEEGGEGGLLGGL